MRPAPMPAPIWWGVTPALSEWGTVAMGVLFLAACTVVIRRRRLAVA